MQKRFRGNGGSPASWNYSNTVTENVPLGWEITSATPNYNTRPSDNQYKWLSQGEGVEDTSITPLYLLLHFLINFFFLPLL